MTTTSIRPLTTDPAREYIAGSAIWGRYRGAVQALPLPIDDLERELGDDVYTQMLHDAQVWSCFVVLKTAILEDGLSLVPHDNDPDGAIAAFCRRALEQLTIPIGAVLWDMLDALAYGSRVAELMYGDGDGEDAGRVTLFALKPKARHTVAFVVDDFLNVLGMQAMPGVWRSTRPDGTDPQQPLPRSKFAILTWWPRNSDPRGTSVLRRAYNAWWLKTQAWPEYLKYLVQFGTPSLVGKAKVGTNADGVSFKQLLFEALLAYQNGTALVVELGEEIEALSGATGAQNDVFPTAVDLFDRQITRAILLQTRATMEAEHGSRADSSTGKDVLDMIVAQGKQALGQMLVDDVLAPLVELNFGPAALQTLPTLALGQTEQEDVIPLMNAVAQLERAGYIQPSQYPAIDARLGLPPRTPEEQQRQAERAAVPPVQAPPPPGQQQGQGDEESATP